MRLFALPALAAVLVCLPSANEIDEVSSPALQRAIEATVPERERLGYTPDDLKHFRFPGRMPAFDAWMADAIAFDAGARDVRGRLRGADGLGAVIETCWTAGGWEIAPDAPVTAAGSLDNVIREWWRARGEEVPEEAIDLALGSLSNEVHPALAHFLVSARACGDQWGRAIDSDRLDAKDIQRLTGRIWELSLDTSQIADLEGGFDRRFAGRAAVRFGAAVEALANALLATDEPRGEGTVTLPTPLGDVVIGAAGDTKHGAPGVLLCVDVSGADTYEPGTACGRLDHPFAAVIDLAGNDEYRSTAARSGAGAGELGVGVVVDCQGDDRYLVEHRGAGYAILGAGIVHDRAGNDCYEGVASSIAVALGGLGLVVDAAGDDRYETFGSGQGLGRPYGAGVLLDRAGNDRYVARDDELIAASPQAAAHNLSMAQGAGYGLRHPDRSRSLSGGLGILLDVTGDDEYRAGVFGQAIGYWYGVGMLFDDAGDDRYHAAFYGQSAATHFGLSYLLEASGADEYSTTLSSSMADARDCSVAILRDVEGDDTYRAPQCSLGCGDVVGTGLFIDGGGADTYTHLPGRNAGVVLFESATTEWRIALPTVGIFLDLGGTENSYGAEDSLHGADDRPATRFESMRGYARDE